jgi:Sulfatase
MSPGPRRRRRGGLLVLAAAVAAGAAVWAIGGTARHELAAAHVRHPPVVLLVLDEFPIASLTDSRGQVDAGRFPNFARLARTSTWFRFATGADDFTRRAVPAILTGRLPRDRRFPVARNYPRNLFTAMHAHYDLDVQESGTRLCPYAACRRDGPNWGAELLAFLRTGRRPGRTARWVASIGPRPRPTLFFAHALFPHRPWTLLPSGRSYFHGFENRPAKADAAEGVDDPFIVAHMWQRHLLQVGYTDRLLGALIDRLERTGLWERALVIVTADHGLAFRVGEYRRTLTAANVGALAPVPLFVKLPGQSAGRTVDRHVRTIDIMPTIGAVAHVALPPGTQGRSLLDAGGETPADELVEMYERGGRLLRLPAPVVRRRLAAVLRVQHARFGERSWSRLYRMGPHQELLGRRAAAAPSRSLRALIDADEEYASVDPRSGYVPSLVTARIVGGRPGRRRDLAVAVDGRIAAVGRSVRVVGDPAEYAMMLVPEEALGAGAHRVELLEVIAGGRALARLGRAG